LLISFSEQVADNTVFSFLTELKKKLLQTYDYDKLMSTSAFGLEDFTDSIKQLIVITLINKQ